MLEEKLTEKGIECSTETETPVAEVERDISSTMVLPALEPEDIEVMKAAFKKADKEGKGKLSANEVKDVLAVVLEAKFDLSAVNDIITLVDDDGDRMLNYEELAKLFTNEPGHWWSFARRWNEWKTLFKMIDVEKDKKLCKKDVARLIKFWISQMPSPRGIHDYNPTEAEIMEEANNLVRTFDEDGDERIDYAEFLKLMVEAD